MRNSLIFKLMGAFLFVIAIGTLVITLLISGSTKDAFTLYTTRNGQMWAERMKPVLANYYTKNGSWQGVETILKSDAAELKMSPAPMAGTNMMGPGAQPNAPAPAANSGMMAPDQRLVLADAKGEVVYDTQSELDGKQLTSKELEEGTSIQVDDKSVGTIIVSNNSLSGNQSMASCGSNL